MDRHSKPHIFFLGDPLDTLKAESDSSLLLLNGYKTRDLETSWHTAKDISLQNNTLYLSGHKVEKKDIVWIRNEPHNTIQYYEMMRLLCHVDARFLNCPKAILSFHDKLSTLYIEHSRLCTAASIETTKKIWDDYNQKGHKQLILKVPSRFGGTGIKKVNSKPEAIETAKELLKDSGYIIIQPYISTGEEQTDTRVVITPTQILGSLDRVAPENDYICNISKNGFFRIATPLSKKQEKMLKNIQELMKKENIFLAGIDFLGDFLTEINITCPATLVKLNELYKTKTENKIIDESLAL